MKALVTGAAGFIGRYLVFELLERGFRVVAFDSAPPPKDFQELDGRIPWVCGDLRSEVDLYRVMAKEHVTDIFHLGALLAEDCEADPMKGFRVNFHSTQTLLDAAASLGINRFVMLSSISVFGKDAEEPVTDDAPKNPETVYGQTKLACEHLLKWYEKKHGLDTRALRFTWVFGPGRSRGITALYSSRILDAFGRGENLEIPNPDERGDWLYIKDAVKAILCLWASVSAPQRVYNIAGGVHSIREVVDIARKMYPRAPITMAERGKTLSPYPAAYDDTPARQDLSWKPDYGIEKAVREHLAIVSEA